MRTSLSSGFNLKTKQSNAGEAFLRSDYRESEFNSLFVKGTKNPFTHQSGFDLTHIPGRPRLHSSPQIQCCAKDGGICSCSKCQETKNENGISDEYEQSIPIPEPAGTSPELATPSQPSETISSHPVESTAVEQSDQISSLPVEVPGVESATRSEETVDSVFLTEDSVEDLSEGQMKKTDFLQKLRSEICRTIEPVVSRVGQTAENCPYLNYWMDFYQEKDAKQIEKTVGKYAPDTATAKSAEEYISIISQRALRAAEIWATTGRISGVPAGVPVNLPAEALQRNDNRESAATAVQYKAKNGGTGKANDPRSIQKELGQGQPLETGVRLRMESAFGTSFSHVRTHTDSSAIDLSNRVNARAFTLGNHVAFASGEYKPNTLLGDALIAHELAHTMQQQGAKQSIDKLEVGTPSYDQLETDADHAAMGAVNLLWSKEKQGSILQQSLPMLRSGFKLQRCATTQKNTPATPVPATPQTKTPPTTAPPATPPTTSGTPCPTGVRVGAIVQKNHSDLSSTDKEVYRTELGAMSRMDLDPGPDHSGHCMKEKLVTKTNTCPKEVYIREGITTAPCTGNKCLDVNNSISAWGLKDGPTSFLDMHRTRQKQSVLEGTGVNSCTVVCEQIYSCDRKQPTTGTFIITRNFKAGTHKKADGSSIHITTGTVTKT